VFQNFDHSAITVMLTAHSKARELDSFFIASEHILLSLLETQQAKLQQLLEPIPASLEELRMETEQIAKAKSAGYGRENGDDTTMHFTQGTHQILMEASETAKGFNRQVAADDLLAATFGLWTISPSDLRKSIEERLDILESSN
jgi:ATP-dependent Clp protease ATP-binding subunit ClpA